MKTYAIIPSGGVGKRLKSSLPKQYVKVNGKELIAYTIEIFQQCEDIDEIVIAAQKEFFPLLKKIKLKYNFTKLAEIVEGGAERQDSVFNAVKSLTAHNKDIVLVHDAARPLLSQSILKNALNEAKNFDNIVVAIKAADTLISGSEYVENYLERSKIFYVQTPQISRYKILLDALNSAKSEYYTGTDESNLLYRASNRVKIVEGSALNFKITTQSDLDLFNKICDIEIH